MTGEECIAAARQFLALFDRAEGPVSLTTLERMLDRLTFAATHVQPEFDEREWPDPPRRGMAAYDARRAAAVRCFPSLGFYSVADPLAEPGEKCEPLVGDAIDDLADIACDLQEVIWRWENTSREDAIWLFRFNYRTHWGEHARQLQVYLHALLRSEVE